MQGLLHVYETFTRGDGHTVKLPPDRGEGQQWATRAGQSLQRAGEGAHRSVERPDDPRSRSTRRSRRCRTCPDTKYVKHIRIQSERLPKFWGRHMYLGAIVVLPGGLGLASATRAIRWRSTTVTFSATVTGWRETPPDPKLPRRRSRTDREVLPERPRGRAAAQGRLRPGAAGVRLRVLQGVDGPGLPARDHGHDPARQSVLRRLVRGELGEPRPVRRRDHLRADSATSRRRFAASARGRARLRRLDRRVGSARRAGVLSRTSTTARSRIAPIRSTSAATRTSTSTRTPTPTTPRGRSGARRGRRNATTSGRRERRSSRTT